VEYYVESIREIEIDGIGLTLVPDNRSDEVKESH
jgi:hypothetical protein